MSVTDAWNGCKIALSAQLRASKDLEHAASLVRQVIERIQHQTMSEQKDAVLRQQIGILFSCAKTSCEALTSAGEAKLWVSGETKGKTNRVTPELLLSIAFTLFIGAAGVLCYLNKSITEVLLIGGAAICAVAALIVRMIQNRKKEQPKPDYKVDIKADTDRLIAFLDKLMPLIDKHIDELAYLNAQKSRQQDEIDGELLELCSQMLEAQRSGDASVACQALPAVEQYLRHLGVEIVDYSAKTEKFFKVLPAKKGERTIAPAFIKEGKLLRHGLAAVCNEQ